MQTIATIVVVISTGSNVVNEYVKRVQLHCVSYSLPDFISVTEGQDFITQGEGGGCIVRSHSAECTCIGTTGLFRTEGCRVADHCVPNLQLLCLM